MDPLYGQRTTHLTEQYINKKWIIIDAKDMVLGRLASVVANRLMGKHLPHFQPGFHAGDNIIIINAAKLAVTGQKMDQKEYFWYSGFPGGLKSRNMQTQMELNAEKVVQHALKGMLPKTKYGKALLKKVRIFNDEKHNMAAQQPVEVKI